MGASPLGPARVFHSVGVKNSCNQYMWMHGGTNPKNTVWEERGADCCRSSTARERYRQQNLNPACPIRNSWPVPSLIKVRYKILVPLRPRPYPTRFWHFRRAPVAIKQSTTPIFRFFQHGFSSGFFFPESKNNFEKLGRKNHGKLKLSTEKKFRLKFVVEKMKKNWQSPRDKKNSLNRFFDRIRGNPKIFLYQITWLVSYSWLGRRRIYSREFLSKRLESSHTQASLGWSPVTSWNSTDAWVDGASSRIIITKTHEELSSRRFFSIQRGHDNSPAPLHTYIGLVNKNKGPTIHSQWAETRPKNIDCLIFFLNNKFL